MISMYDEYDDEIYSNKGDNKSLILLNGDQISKIYNLIIEQQNINNIIGEELDNDISEEMIAAAKDLYKTHKKSSFTTVADEIEAHDYVIANGIFNVKLEFDGEDWKDYIKYEGRSTTIISSHQLWFN